MSLHEEVKPFTLEELSVWWEKAERDDWRACFVGSDIRRLIGAVKQALTPAATPQTLFTNGCLSLDTVRKEVFIGGFRIDLTRRELRLLEYFIKNMGRMLPPREVLKQVWGPAYVDDNHYLRIGIFHLRKKIGDDWITTKPWEGYIMEKRDVEHTTA